METGRIAIDVAGVAIGHSQNEKAATGVTVIRFDHKCPAGASLCGTATSTRQFDGLAPEHIVSGVNALVLTGGSAFGLDAGGGVMQWMAEHRQGTPTRYGRVPSCPTAALYDLGLGHFSVRPDGAMGYRACSVATYGETRIGSVGCGCGATVGKLFGVSQATKGGFGSHSVQAEGVTVQAFVGVNAFGDVIDPQSGAILAGARESEADSAFLNIEKALAEGRMPEGFGKPSPENTVLCALVTDAALDKAQCCAAADLAVEGLRRVLRPALTPFDGDVVVVAATGTGPAATPEQIGALGAAAIAEAILCGVRAADGLGLLPAMRDLG